MKTRIVALLFVLSLGMVATAVEAEGPRPVSPGAVEGQALIEQRCPTFSWAGAAGASAYELVVYRLEAIGTETVKETFAPEAPPLLRVVLPGTASSWTPAESSCLSYGARYAWSIRTLGDDQEQPWSDVQIFEVAALPPETALHTVLRRVVSEMVDTGELSADEAEALHYLMSPGASLPPAVDDRAGDSKQTAGTNLVEESLTEENPAAKTDDVPSSPTAPVAVGWDSVLGEDLQLASANEVTIFADASDAALKFFLADTSLGMELDGSFAGTAGGFMSLFAANRDGGGSMVNTMLMDGQGFGASGELLMYGQPTAGGAASRTVELRATENADDGASLRLFKMDGTEAINLDAEWGGAGGDSRIWTQELQITGGSDLCEHFEIHGAVDPEPGMVVTIADGGTSLEVSHQPYNRSVAGVISGAGGLKPGLYMGQADTEADGQYPVALTGRVYVWADASTNSIRPGDLLTTSAIPGHAMKVVDYERGQGAILGKAMSTLDEGRGLVLALVSLQ